MTSVVNQKFALKPVVAALALATAAGSAFAAPTPNQMPGGGIVTALSPAGQVQVNGSGPLAINTAIVNLPNPTEIDVIGKVVLRWGVNGLGEVTNPLGFNTGSNAVLTFAAVNTGENPPAVLNVDVSGNPSQLFGLMASITGPTVNCGLCNTAPAVFVANGNGIVVGAGGRIVAPTGLGLIGANMSGQKSIDEFVGNNGWVVPALPTYGVSYIDYAAGNVSSKGNVEISGAINGDFILNKPAQYVLLAGNNVTVTNTGNVFGLNVTVDAGVYATGTLAAVAGLSNQAVNRIWNVDAGAEESCCTVGPFDGQLSLTGTSGHFLNEGSVSAAGTGTGEWIAIQAAGNVRSGIMGDADVLKGLFSDQGIYVDSYSNSTAIELYNVVSGYTTNKTLPFLHVGDFSAQSGFRPDVTINAITPGLQPSSITTTDEVLIYGGNVSILSTINHKSNASGGTQNDANLVINGSKSVNVAADVGAGADVEITATGPLTISGNVLSDTDGGGNGGIYVYNNTNGAETTISGTLTVPGSSFDSLYVNTSGPTTISGTLASSNDVNVWNYGTLPGNHTTISGNVFASNDIWVWQDLSPANAPITISGNMVAGNNIWVENYGASAGNTTTISGSLSAGNSVYITHYGLPTGSLTVSGTVFAGTDVEMFSDGNAQLGGGGITALDDIFATVLGTSLKIDGPWSAGDYLNITSPLALAKLTPAGVLSSPTIALAGISFQGVNDSYAPYADTSEKPAQQLVTNNLGVVLTGSMNGPIAGNTNWLLNSMDIAPMFTLAPVMVSVTAVGAGFQAVNLHVMGDMVANSGATTTPFIGVPLTTGGLPAGGIQGNLGSQLILQSDGYMQVMGTPTLTLFGPLAAFQWPGGAVFKAGTTLQTFAPVYNAWSTASPPYGGLFFEAPYIALGGYLAVSGTAWANFSTQPVTGDPIVYQIRQLSPTSFGFEATDAFVKNAYSNSVTGGFVCTTLGSTTWATCP